MKNEIKEITEIITRLQDCGRKRISRTEGVIVNNEDIATALDKAGYRKQSETVKEFADKVIDVIFSHSGIAQDCSKVLASPEILQDEINDLAAEFGKEE